MTKTERAVVLAAMRLYEHWLSMKPIGIGERHWFPLNSEREAKSLGRACACYIAAQPPRKRTKKLNRKGSTT